MVHIKLDDETVDQLDRFDELRQDDETYDEIVTEFSNSYEAEEFTMFRSGDG